MTENYCSISRPQLSNEGDQLRSCNQEDTETAPISPFHTTHNNIQSPTRAICCYSVNLKKNAKPLHNKLEIHQRREEYWNPSLSVLPPSKWQREIPSLPSERLGVHTLHNKATMQSIVICLPISSSFSYFYVSPLLPFLCHSFTPCSIRPPSLLLFPRSYYWS